MKNKSLLVFFYGAVHFFASLTSVVVSATLIGISLPIAFLTTGLSTILFHVITKHRIPSINGISGSFVSVSVLVAAKFGLSDLFGAVIITGLAYILFGVVLYYRPNFFDFIPAYILNTCIVLVSLSLIPLGLNSITDPIMMLITLVAVVLFSLHPKFRLYAMPFALLIATLAQCLLPTNGFQIQIESFQWVVPTFNLEAILMLVLTGVAVLGEVLGDVRNLSRAAKRDIEKEVGISRILIGNGLSTLISGFLNGGSIATYSESVGVVYATQYRDSRAQIVAAFIYILLACSTKLMSLAAYIPVTALGVLLVYLFVTVFINTVTSYRLTSENEGSVIILILTIFYLTPIFFPTISNIFIALVVGIIADKLLRK